MPGRTDEEFLKYRNAFQAYQRCCIDALLNQTIDVLILRSGWTLKELINLFAEQESQYKNEWFIYQKASEFFDKNSDIDFPGKKEYVYFLLSENLSGEGTI